MPTTIDVHATVVSMLVWPQIVVEQCVTVNEDGSLTEGECEE